MVSVSLIWSFDFVAYQLSRHDLSLVHKVVYEPVFLPVQSVNFPGNLSFTFAFVLFVDCLFHLLFKILNNLHQFVGHVQQTMYNNVQTSMFEPYLLNELPSLRWLSALQLSRDTAHVCGRSETSINDALQQEQRASSKANKETSTLDARCTFTQTMICRRFCSVIAINTDKDPHIWQDCF